MMSDEEDIDGKFKVHRQDWQSDEFNDFMEELDACASTSNSKLHPRISRYYGMPQKTRPPTNALEWMISISSADESEILALNSPN